MKNGSHPVSCEAFVYVWLASNKSVNPPLSGHRGDIWVPFILESENLTECLDLGVTLIKVIRQPEFLLFSQQR